MRNNMEIYTFWKVFINICCWSITQLYSNQTLAVFYKDKYTSTYNESHCHKYMNHTVDQFNFVLMKILLLKNVFLKTIHINAGIT